MPEDAPIYNSRRLLITTDDGTLFSCEPKETTGVQLPKQIYWSVIATNGVAYVVTPYYKRQTDDEVRALVNEWWEQKKSAGQVGVNAFAMKLMVVNGLLNREN